jgi:cholesterol oxidase
MKRGSEWLSQGAELLAAKEDATADAPPHFDLLIVGSGYGGAVAAARVAEWARREGQPVSIALLERGLEYLPGDFPKTLDELSAHVRISGGARAGIRGWRDGLFDVRLGQDVNALVANGLGGGSLINAAVAEEADAASLADPAWPAPWFGNTARWKELYDRARGQLAASRWQPTGVPKEAAMRKLGCRLGGKATPVVLTIQLPRHDDPQASPPLQGCKQCGDCFTGCNVGAKRTLGTTYLKRARDLGVEIYTGATVLKVERGDAAWPWVVRWAFSDPKRLPAREQAYKIRAGRVVLAAGTFGSTEILLRSQCPGLRFSSQLGTGFSTNGDVIGAQYGLPEEVGAWAKDNLPREKRHAGPTITHQVELDRDDKTPARRLVVQDLTVPASLGWLFGELLTSLMLPQRWTRFDLRRRGPASPDPAIVDDRDGGGLSRTLLLSAFGHDGAAGRLHALPGFDEAQHDGNLVVHWPGAGEAECFEGADRRLLRATGKTDAFWLRNPLWQAVPDSPLLDQLTKRQVFTVHPLGGCRMAPTMNDGAVDPFGRVFDAGAVDAGGAAGRPGAQWAAREDQRIHQGLYVLDGSIVPTSLGINPLLTITALAEGIIEQWLVDWQAELKLASKELPQVQAPVGPWPVLFPTPEAWPVTAQMPPAAAAATDLCFRERMHGVLDTRLQATGQDTEHLRVGVKFEFQKIKDVQAFLRRLGKRLRFTGELELTCTSWDPVKGRQEDLRSDKGPIRGHVKWFSQRPAGVLGRVWRTFWAWRQLRAAADLFDIASDGTPMPSILLRPRDWRKFLCRAWHFLKLLTHFGAPRLLEYRFKLIENLTVTTGGGHTFTLPKGTVLCGTKSLVYERDANPWVQLTQMPLRFKLPGSGSVQELATIRYDELFMLGRDELPLVLTHQHDGVTGLRDALSLLLYLGRVIFQQHFLSFRKPDYAPRRALHRLPWQDAATRYPQLEWRIFDDVLVAKPKAGGGAIKLRLTRIRMKAPPGGAPGEPVLLLHGFGSGGIQYTHEAIPAPMAQWLADQGREVWVGEMRTSIGLPTCEQQWVMDDVALEDIPTLVDAVQACRHDEGAPRDAPIDIVAHCIGSAMFCMAVLARKLDGKIRRAVLMQVGPIVHLPRGNRMRGYIGNRLQKLFGAGLVNSTVADDASDADVALDRVLATFPYMGKIDDSGQRQRESDPMLALNGDLRHNGRLANTMRSAGVFAQLFQWPNLYDRHKALDNQPLLDALPDLLGPCNLTTYQQTAQYAFLRRLTNQDGDNAYVTDANVASHMNFPILFVQGRLNDVFSPRGTHESQRLLRRINPAQTVERLVVQDFGHLDCVVGLEAQSKVFSKMLPFLQTGQHTPATPAFAPDEIDFRAPSIGPWIGDAQWQPDGGLQLRVGLKVDEQRSPPSRIYSVLVVHGEPVAASLTEHVTPVPVFEHGFPALSELQSTHALAFHPEGEAVLQIYVPAAMCAAVEVWLCTPDGIWPDTPMSASDFVHAWKARRLERPQRAPRSEVELPIDNLLIDSEWLAASRPDAQDFSFAVMSCRQSPLLVDRPVADKAFAHLAQHIGSVHHVLMVGDQIYADSLAASGGVDGTRLRFFDAYREAWTAPHQRDLMRRRPFYMAVDDHEFRDDHNSAVRLKHLREWSAALDAMWRYQYAAGPLGIGRADRLDGQFWYSMRTASFHTFVCDSRNRRFEDDRVDGSQSRIIQDSQFNAIRQWLADSRASQRPRFLVLPTPVAPVFRVAVERPLHRLRCDDWQRFPDSLCRLFDLLIEDGAEQLVLLSGDYHCFVDCELKVTRGRNSATCRSITTSGAYCPYEFANTEEDELWQPTAQQPHLICGAYQLTYRIDKFAAGPGYTRIVTHGRNPVTAHFVVVPGSMGRRVAEEHLSPDPARRAPTPAQAS